MINLTRSTIFAAAAFLLAGPSLAQNAAPAVTPPAAAEPAPQQGFGRGGGNGEMRERLMAADTNKDGQWSREEWLAAGRRDRGFDMMDADKNGQITREELRAGMERMQGMRGQRQRSAN